MSEEIGSGFLLPENVPGQASSREYKARLDSLLEARRAKPELQLQEAAKEPAPWEEFWRDLMEERDKDGKRRWDWRKALYIAWHCVPTSKRWPKHKYELMDLLGVNDATARKWRQGDPEIDERIASGPKALLAGHVANVLDALVTVATKAEAQSHQDRKLFLELAGVYKPKGELALEGLFGSIEIDYSKLTTEQLERIADGENVLKVILDGYVASGGASKGGTGAQEAR